MAPKDKVVVDGTHPGEGGEIEVGHQAVQTISPQDSSGLHPFNDQLEQDIDDANNYKKDEPEIVKQDQPEQAPAKEQVSEQGNQPQANSPEQLAQSTKAEPSVAEHGLEPDHSGMYSTNPASVSQGLGNYHPTKSVIGTPDNVNPAALNRPTLNNLPTEPKRRFSLKKTLLFAIPFLILLGGAIYVFAFYLPNTPQNVWNTSINRTGKQVDALVNKLSEQDALVAYEKTKIKVEGSLETGGQKFQINVDSNYDSQNSDTKAALQSDDASGGVIQLEALLKTQLPEDAQFPNIYFNLKGIKDLGLDGYLNGISDFDGKWIAIEQDYINSLLDSANTGGEQEQEQGPTYQDIMSIVNDFNDATQQYLFNSDAESSILVLKEFVGTEESEGITANHYKAGINGANLQAWCNALVDKLANNQAFKDISGITEDTLQKELEQQKKQCQEIDKDIEADDSFDIWMDKKNKIIHKIRIYEEPSKAYTEQINDIRKQADYEECLANNNGRSEPCEGILASDVDTEQDLGTKYYEFGQVYKGRNQVLIFYNDIEESKDRNSNTRLELTVNTDNLAFGGRITSVQKSDYDDTKLDISIATEPFAGDIDSSKPDGAIPIQEFLKTILGSENPYAEVQANARDSKRQSDISNLHAGLEAYFVQAQTYPSYKQINDTEFRNENLKGIPEETYSDPGASGSRLSDRAGINVYSYVVVPTSCDGKSKICTYYELSATLDDGSVYSKKALQ